MSLPRAELPGEIAEVLVLLESQSIDPAAVQKLRAELEASFGREQELRDALSVEAAEPAASAGQGESELRAFELALEERERELARSAPSWTRSARLWAGQSRSWRSPRLETTSSRSR